MEELILLTLAAALVAAALALMREIRRRRALERLVYFFLTSWRNHRESSSARRDDALADGDAGLPMERRRAGAAIDPHAGGAESSDGPIAARGRRRGPRTHRRRR